MVFSVCILISFVVRLLFVKMSVSFCMFNHRFYSTARRINGKSKKKRQSLYSIEFSHPVDTILDYEMESGRNVPVELSPKPMTPRRVKRRSVMTRGTNNRQSTTSRRSHASTNNRSSTRASRRKIQQNPVTKLMDLQQNHNQPIHSGAHSSQYLQHNQNHRLSKSYASSQNSDNSSNLTKTNLKQFNADIPSVNLNKSFRKPNNFTQNIAPDPIYYNMSQSSTFCDPSWNASSSTNLTMTHEAHVPHGHYNPTYQHSTPNLADNPEHVDEVYNNRPPSVRSSYSNFHGARPLSTIVTESENVFVGLNSAQPSTSSRVRSQPMPVPKLPSRQSVSRESLQSMSFLNNGPPAYNLNYHTPPDSNSETTM